MVNPCGKPNYTTTKRLGCSGSCRMTGTFCVGAMLQSRQPVVIGFPTSSRTRPLSSGLRDNSLLPTCGQLRFCLEPVIQIVSVFFSALFEKFVCTEPDCLSQFRPNLVLYRCFSRGGGLSASIHGVFLHSARESCIRHYPSSRRGLTGLVSAHFPEWERIQIIPGVGRKPPCRTACPVSGARRRDRLPRPPWQNPVQRPAVPAW